MRNHRLEPLLGGVLVAMSEYLDDFLNGFPSFFRAAQRCKNEPTATAIKELMEINRGWMAEMWGWIEGDAQNPVRFAQH